jgi:hypothetical protein
MRFASRCAVNESPEALTFSCSADEALTQNVATGAVSHSRWRNGVATSSFGGVESRIRGGE